MIIKKRIKTHCSHGHEVNDQNVYINRTSGSRVCRICRQASQKRCRELLKKRSERMALALLNRSGCE